MKRKKGFTLVELIASIAILAVILLMATISYTKIRKSVLENQYNNLKTVIEQSAVRYSSKTGYFAFFVQELIDENNLETDDDLYIYDPRDDSILNCHLVTVEEDPNGNLRATLLDDDYRDEDSNKCNISELDKYSSRLLLRAYLQGTSIKYGEKNIGEAAQTIFTENENDYPLIYNDWTRYNLDISADTSLITEDLAGARYVWNKNPEAYGEDQVSITTNEQSIFDSYYYLDLYLTNGSHYQARLKYKFDRESPVIYHEKTSLSQYTPNDEWTRSKTIVLYATDKDGVGLERIYVGTSSCETFKNNRSLGQRAIPGVVQTYTFTEPAGENGIDANVCAVDKLGNLADSGIIHISKVDRDAPTCEIGATGVEGTNGWFKKHPTSNTASDSYVRLSLSSTDGDSGSGVAKYTLSASPLVNTNITTNSAALNVTEDSPNKNGKKYYGYVIDAVGNIGRCERVIKRDTVAPSMTIRAFATNKSYDEIEELGFPASMLTGTYTNESTIDFGWNNTGHRLLLTPSDSLSGFSDKENSADRNLRYSYNEAGNTATVNTLPTTYTGYNVTEGVETTNNFGVNYEGKRLVQFTLCDDAGNCITTLIKDNVDKTKPLITLSAYDYKGANSTSISTCPSAPQSGVSCNYEGTNQTPVKGPTNFQADGTLTAGWNLKGTMFHFAVSDSASGLYNVAKRYNAANNLNSWNTTWTENTATTYANPGVTAIKNFWLSLTGKGKRMYQVDATDHAGNKITVTGRTPITDGVACSLDVVEGTLGNGEWYTSSSVKLELTVIGADDSAVTGVRITDSTTVGYDSNTAANKVKTITTNTSSAGKTYYGYVRTTVANYNAVACSITLYKDSTPPTCSYSPTNRTEWSRGYINLKATCSDNHSGCDEDYSGSSYLVGKNINSGTVYNSTPTLEKYKFNTVIKDKAGNQRTCDQEVNVLLDNTPPVIKQSSFASNNGSPDYNNPIKNRVSTKVTHDWNNDGHYFRYYYQDVDSGLASREFYINNNASYGKLEDSSYYDFNIYNAQTGEFTGSPYSTYSYNGEKTEKEFTNLLSSAGNRAQKVVIEDMAGNKASIISEDLIDKSKPSVNVKAYVYKGAPTSNGDCTGTYCKYSSQSTVKNTSSNFDIDWNNKGHYFLVTPTDNQSGVKTVKWKYNAGGNYSAENDISSTSTVYTATCSTNQQCNNSNMTSTLSTVNSNLTSGGKRKGAFEVCDKAGNCKEVTFTDYIDKIPPVIKATAYPYSGDYNATNNNYSNVTAYKGPTTYNNTSVDSPANFTVSGWKKDGVMFVNLYTENESEIVSRLRYLNTAKDYSSYNSLKTTASNTDSYNNNRKTLTTSAAIYSDSSNGLRWIQEKVTDKAGNVAVINMKAAIDTESPKCKLKVSRSTDCNGWYNKDVTISFDSANTSDNQKIAKYYITTSSTLSSITSDSISSLDITTDNAGTTYYGYVQDNAGNIAKCTNSITIKMDKTPPRADVRAYDYIGAYSDHVSDYANATTISNMSVINKNSASMTINGWKKDGVMFVSDYSDPTSKIKSRVRFLNAKDNYTSVSDMNSTASNTDDNLNTATRTTSLGLGSGSDGQRKAIETVCDNACNCTAITYRANIDTVPPTCTLQADRAADYNGWYNSSVQLSFSAKADNPGSGLLYNTIAWSKTVPSSTNNKDSLTVSNSTASNTFWGSVIDKAGNVTYCGKTIKVDINNPSCELQASGTQVSGVDGWYKSDVVITFKTAADATSEIDKYAISTNSNLASSSITGSSSTSVTVDGDTNGTTYYGYVKDKAGRTGKCSITIKRDTTAPDLHIYIYNSPYSSGNTAIKDLYNTGSITYDWNNKGHVYTVKGYDTGVGLASSNNLRYRYNDAGNYSSMNDLGHETYYTITNNTTYTNNYGWSITSGGQRKVEYRVCDKLNNCRTQYVVDKIDTTKPTCKPYILRNSIYAYYTSSVNSPNWSGQDLLFVSNCTDSSQSGIKKLLFTTGSFDVKTVNNPSVNNDGSVTESVNLDTTGLTGFGIYATDNAGNQSVRYCARSSASEGNNAFNCTDGTVWNNHVLAIDKEVPVSSMTFDKNPKSDGSYPAGTKFTFSCTDDHSGISTSSIKDGNTAVGAYVNANTKDQITYTISSTGTHTITHSCTDKVSNVSNTTYTINITSGSSSNPGGSGGNVCRPILDGQGKPWVAFSCNSRCPNPDSSGTATLGDYSTSILYGCHDGTKYSVKKDFPDETSASAQLKSGGQIYNFLVSADKVHYNEYLDSGNVYYNVNCSWGASLTCHANTSNYYRYAVEGYYDHDERLFEIVKYRCDYNTLSTFVGFANQGNLKCVCCQ